MYIRLSPKFTVPIILDYKNIEGKNPGPFIKTEYSMKITGDQNQQISFISCRSKNLPAAFHYVSVVKCLGHVVFNLGGLSIVRVFLGFAFQFFLLNDFFFNCHAPPDLEKLNI